MVIWTGISIVVSYGIILLLMYFLQGQIMYHPQDKIYATPRDVGLEYKDVNFASEDGVDLHGWFIPADRSPLTVLYFHGNAGNISGRLETIQLLHQLGLNVFIFDYRGYGSSKGKPTKEGTYRDAAAAWNYLISERNIAEEQIVIMGRSLGGSIAAWLAARENPAAVVIESTFTSAAELGGEIYPWLPVRFILKHNYDTQKHLQQIDEPLFMAHSRDDQIVPFNHGKKLFELANDPKQFLEMRGYHGSAFMETGGTYREGLAQFLEMHTSYHPRITK